ncbi:MAG: hypothetical protein DMG87_10340 [Acidobacteria bacterium]|nr:MAG: hypothetical protein DMG87_10340 [Acidobacteriota bacterium]
MGLGRFAQVALDVAQVMPPYRTCFSKRQFSQPQLLAILCFMRYEDWTFRETEVRLSEHGELRRALALASVPDYTTLQPFLRRLLEPDLEHALEDSRASRAGEAAKANHGGRRCHRACPRRGEHVLSAAHVSPHPAALPWRRWLKWSAVVDVERQLILSQSARQAPGNSSVAHLGPLSHQG